MNRQLNHVALAVVLVVWFSASWEKSNTAFAYNVSLSVGEAEIITFEIASLNIESLKEGDEVLRTGNGILNIEKENTNSTVLGIDSGQYYLTGQ